MQAIVTKYLGPTNTRGARIVARTASGNSVTLPYKHELDTFENHERAARALMHKIGWTGKIAGGSTRTGYVFVDAAGARDPRRRRRDPRRARRR